ncbi:TRAP transporter substrate-binding protein [Ruegeria meonggei]|uniref:Monocarboxylate 2-oxoacid-binding periplasmic protein n=1 Tax=Ruegeria meonggei TaxID=1446476 RepID=A0A1X7A0S0_9RHOB|nr:TRAP transporter substrate-binding protein [Ruegeria meonggei]SLN67425.1 Monocarboxylate 2-oxoacid-binding periplasmic protein precursor [Ruegeria meonggei]
MNFKLISRRTVFGTMAGAVAAACLGAAASADTVRLRFHTYFGTEIDDIAKEFRDAVKDRTDGEVRIQYFRGGELVPSDQLVDAVAKGTIDMAHGVGSYWSGQVDIGNIETGLPGAWTTIEEAKEVLGRPEAQALLTEAYAEAGTVFLGKSYGSDYDLLTKEPITSLDDLKNFKIRATSNVAKVLQQFDIPTVSLPGQELYVGLSTGVIDGVIYGSAVDYHHLKLNESAKHYTRLNMLTPGWTETYLANPDTWAKLSDEQRTIVEEELANFAANVEAWLNDGNKSFPDDIFEFSTLPAEDTKALTEAAQSVWAEEAGRSERNQKLIDLIVANAKAQGRL